eukprot:jgi/Botrbrau1/402/Bobra.110_2s0053.2
MEEANQKQQAATTSKRISLEETPGDGASGASKPIRSRALSSGSLSKWSEEFWRQAFQSKHQHNSTAVDGSSESVLPRLTNLQAVRWVPRTCPSAASEALAECLHFKPPESPPVDDEPRPAKSPLQATREFWEKKASGSDSPTSRKLQFSPRKKIAERGVTQPLGEQGVKSTGGEEPSGSVQPVVHAGQYEPAFVPGILQKEPTSESATAVEASQGFVPSRPGPNMAGRMPGPGGETGGSAIKKAVDGVGKLSTEEDAASSIPDRLGAIATNVTGVGALKSHNLSLTPSPEKPDEAGGVVSKLKESESVETHASSPSVRKDVDALLGHVITSNLVGKESHPEAEAPKLAGSTKGKVLNTRTSFKDLGVSTEPEPFDSEFLELTEKVKEVVTASQTVLAEQLADLKEEVLELRRSQTLKLEKEHLPSAQADPSRVAPFGQESRRPAFAVRFAEEELPSPFLLSSSQQASGPSCPIDFSIVTDEPRPSVGATARTGLNGQAHVLPPPATAAPGTASPPPKFQPNALSTWAEYLADRDNLPEARDVRNALASEDNGGQATGADLEALLLKKHPGLAKKALEVGRRLLGVAASLPIRDLVSVRGKALIDEDDSEDSEGLASRELVHHSRARGVASAPPAPLGPITLVLGQANGGPNSSDSGKGLRGKLEADHKAAATLHHAQAKIAAAFEHGKAHGLLKHVKEQIGAALEERGRVHTSRGTELSLPELPAGPVTAAQVTAGAPVAPGRVTGGSDIAAALASAEKNLRHREAAVRGATETMTEGFIGPATLALDPGSSSPGKAAGSSGPEVAKTGHNPLRSAIDALKEREHAIATRIVSKLGALEDHLLAGRSAGSASSGKCTYVPGALATEATTRVIPSPGIDPGRLHDVVQRTRGKIEAAVEERGKVHTSRGTEVPLPELLAGPVTTALVTGGAPFAPVRATGGSDIAAALASAEKDLRHREAAVQGAKEVMTEGFVGPATLALDPRSSPAGSAAGSAGPEVAKPKYNPLQSAIDALKEREHAVAARITSKLRTFEDHLLAGRSAGSASAGKCTYVPGALATEATTRVMPSPARSLPDRAALDGSQVEALAEKLAEAGKEAAKMGATGLAADLLHENQALEERLALGGVPAPGWRAPTEDNPVHVKLEAVEHRGGALVQIRLALAEQAKAAGALAGPALSKGDRPKVSAPSAGASKEDADSLLAKVQGNLKVRQEARKATGEAVVDPPARAALAGDGSGKLGRSPSAGFDPDRPAVEALARRERAVSKRVSSREDLTLEDSPADPAAGGSPGEAGGGNATELPENAGTAEKGREGGVNSGLLSGVAAGLGGTAAAIGLTSGHTQAAKEGEEEVASGGDSGIIPRLQIKGPDGTSQRVLGVGPEIRTSPGPARLPSLGLNFPDGAGRTPTPARPGGSTPAGAKEGSPQAAAGGPPDFSKPSPSLTISSKMQAIAARGVEVANTPVQSPSPEAVRRPKAADEEQKPQSMGMEKDLSKDDATMPGKESATTAADAPEVAGQGQVSADEGKLSLKQRLEQQSAAFTRPTTRGELLKDWRAPQKTSDAPASTAAAAKASALPGAGPTTALEEAGGKKGALAGEPTVPQQSVDAGDDLGDVLAGSSAALKPASAKPDAAEAGGVSQSLPHSLSQGRLDSVPEAAFPDDIMASTSSVGEMRRWKNLDGLRTFSLLSTETEEDLEEALLQEFEPQTTPKLGSLSAAEALEASAGGLAPKLHSDLPGSSPSDLMPRVIDPGLSTPAGLPVALASVPPSSATIPGAGPAPSTAKLGVEPTEKPSPVSVLSVAPSPSKPGASASVLPGISANISAKADSASAEMPLEKGAESSADASAKQGGPTGSVTAGAPSAPSVSAVGALGGEVGKPGTQPGVANLGGAALGGAAVVDAVAAAQKPATVAVEPVKKSFSRRFMDRFSRVSRKESSGSEAGSPLAASSPIAGQEGPLAKTGLGSVEQPSASLPLPEGLTAASAATQSKPSSSAGDGATLTGEATLASAQAGLEGSGIAGDSTLATPAVGSASATALPIPNLGAAADPVATPLAGDGVSEAPDHGKAAVAGIEAPLTGSATPFVAGSAGLGKPTEGTALRSGAALSKTGAGDSKGSDPFATSLGLAPALAAVPTALSGTGGNLFGPGGGAASLGSTSGNVSAPSAKSPGSGPSAVADALGSSGPGPRGGTASLSAEKLRGAAADAVKAVSQDAVGVAKAAEKGAAPVGEDVGTAVKKGTYKAGIAVEGAEVKIAGLAAKAQEKAKEKTAIAASKAEKEAALLARNAEDKAKKVAGDLESKALKATGDAAKELEVKAADATKMLEAKAEGAAVDAANKLEKEGGEVAKKLRGKAQEAASDLGKKVEDTEVLAAQLKEKVGAGAAELAKTVETDAGDLAKKVKEEAGKAATAAGKKVEKDAADIAKAAEEMGANVVTSAAEKAEKVAAGAGKNLEEGAAAIGKDVGAKVQEAAAGMAKRTEEDVLGIAKKAEGRAEATTTDLKAKGLGAAPFGDLLGDLGGAAGAPQGLLAGFPAGTAALGSTVGTAGAPSIGRPQGGSGKEGVEPSPAPPVSLLDDLLGSGSLSIPTASQGTAVSRSLPPISPASSQYREAPGESNILGLDEPSAPALLVPSRQTPPSEIEGAGKPQATASIGGMAEEEPSDGVDWIGPLLALAVWFAAILMGTIYSRLGTFLTAAADLIAPKAQHSSESSGPVEPPHTVPLARDDGGAGQDGYAAVVARGVSGGARYAGKNLHNFGNNLYESGSQTSGVKAILCVIPLVLVIFLGSALLSSLMGGGKAALVKEVSPPALAQRHGPFGDLFWSKPAGFDPMGTKPKTGWFGGKSTAKDAKKAAGKRRKAKKSGWFPWSKPIAEEELEEVPKSWWGSKKPSSKGKPAKGVTSKGKKPAQATSQPGTSPAPKKQSRWGGSKPVPSSQKEPSADAASSPAAKGGREKPPKSQWRILGWGVQEVPPKSKSKKPGQSKKSPGTASPVADLEQPSTADSAGAPSTIPVAATPDSSAEAPSATDKAAPSAVDRSVPTGTAGAGPSGARVGVKPVDVSSKGAADAMAAAELRATKAKEAGEKIAKAKAEAEAAKKRRVREAEALAKEEAEKRKAEEDAEKRKAEEKAEKRKADEEAAKAQAEKEAAAKAEAEGKKAVEAAKEAEEQSLKERAAEEAAAKKKAEAAKRKAEKDAAEAAAKAQAEAAQARVEAEKKAEEKRKAEEAEKRASEEAEKKKAAEEAAAAKRAEEDARRKRAEIEAAQRKADAEAQAKADEAAAAKADAEAKAKAEADAQAAALLEKAQESSAGRLLASQQGDLQELSKELVADKEPESKLAVETEAEERLLAIKSKDMGSKAGITGTPRGDGKGPFGAGVLSGLAEAGPALFLATAANRAREFLFRAPSTRSTASPASGVASWLPSRSVAKPSEKSDAADLGEAGAQAPAATAGLLSTVAGLLAKASDQARLTEQLPTYDSLQKRLASYVPSYEAALEKLPSLKNYILDSAAVLEKLPSLKDTVPGYSAAVEKLANLKRFGAAPRTPLEDKSSVARSTPSDAATAGTLSSLRNRIPTYEAAIASLPSVKDFVPSFEATIGKLASLKDSVEYGATLEKLPDVKAYIPTYDAALEKLAYLRSYVPEYGAALEKLPGLKGYLPSNDRSAGKVPRQDGASSFFGATLQKLPSMKDYVPGLGATLGKLPEWKDYVPSYEAVTGKLPSLKTYLPTSAPTSETLQKYIPTMEQLSGLKDQIPSLTATMERLPSLKDLLPSLRRAPGTQGQSALKDGASADASGSPAGGWLDRLRSISEHVPGLGTSRKQATASSGGAFNPAGLLQKLGIKQYIPGGAGFEKLPSLKGFVPSIDKALEKMGVGPVHTPQHASGQTAGKSASPGFGAFLSGLPSIGLPRTGTPEGVPPQDGPARASRSAYLSLGSLKEGVSGLGGLVGDAAAGGSKSRSLPSRLPSPGAKSAASAEAGAFARLSSKLPSLGSLGGRFSDPAALLKSLPDGTSLLNRLPSWSSLLAKAGLAAGPSSLGGLPTWDSLKESLSSFGKTTAKSAGGYVPTWDGVKKSASTLGSDLKDWIPQGATKLPSVASLNARLDGLKESIPSISSLREKLPGLRVGLGASLPTFSSLTGKLPQFSDLVPRLPSVGNLPSLEALGKRLATLQNRIPSVATVRTRAAAGAAVLGGYGRRALGSADDSHDTEYGLGIVAALVLAALLGLKLKDSAASASQTTTPAATSSGGGALSKGVGAPRDTSVSGSNLPVEGSPASAGNFSLVDSVLASGSMATAGASGDRSLPTRGAAADRSVAPGGVGSGVLTAQLNGGGPGPAPAFGVAGTADSAIRGVSTSPGSGSRPSLKDESTQSLPAGSSASATLASNQVGLLGKAKQAVETARGNPQTANQDTPDQGGSLLRDASAAIGKGGTGGLGAPVDASIGSLQASKEHPPLARGQGPLDSSPLIASAGGTNSTPPAMGGGVQGPEAEIIEASLAANPDYATALVEGTPNAWGILAQRWGAPDADPSKITEHPVDKVKKISEDSDRVGTVAALSGADLAAIAAGVLPSAVTAESAMPTSGEASRSNSAVEAAAPALPGSTGVVSSASSKDSEPLFGAVLAKDGKAQPATGRGTDSKSPTGTISNGLPANSTPVKVKGSQAPTSSLPEGAPSVLNGTGLHSASSSPSGQEVLPVSTKAGGPVDADEAPSGIGRYRVGASDPISQKVAAELQDSVSRGPAGGGKYVVTKSAISRATSAKRRAEMDAAEAKSTGCGSIFSSGAEGGGFLCCATPTKVKE